MRWPAGLAAVVGLIGCERARDARDPIELPLPTVHVQLVDPGSEPRAPIRFEPTIAAGTKWTARRVLTITGAHRPARTVTEVFDLELIAVDHGETHTQATLRTITVEPALTNHDPNAGVGDTIDSWRDARAAYTRPSLLSTRSKDSEWSTMRPELAVIAPEQPVGVGARWHEDIEKGNTRASVDVELLARDADRFRERLTFHTERSVSKHPASVDGTATFDTGLHTLHGSLSGSSTVVVHDPDRGDVQLRETIEEIASP